MTTNTPTTRILAATAALVALTLQGNAGAQTSSASTPLPHRNLQLKESGGEPKGYAFLLPILPNGRIPEVLVQLSPENNFDPPDEWTWEVVTSDNELKSALSMKWYAQASCPDALTLLQVSGPGGTLTQNPLWNPIWGYFNTQSFTIDTVKDKCVNWSNAHTCDPADPGTGCATYETFDLVGGVSPAGPADQLRLRASCAAAARCPTSTTLRRCGCAAIGGPTDTRRVRRSRRYVVSAFRRTVTVRLKPDTTYRRGLA